MTVYKAIDLQHTASKNQFLLDYHGGKVPAVISGHTLGAISIKCSVDMGEHVAASTRYLGARLTAIGQVFDFQLTNIGAVIWVQSLLRVKGIPADAENYPYLLDYTYLAIDELTPGSIAGIVSSGTEAGVVGATVTVSKGGFSKSTTSIADGVFVIADIPVDTGYALVAAKTGYVSAGATVNVAEGAETSQNMAMVKHGSCVGVTKDQDGTALGSVPVTLTKVSPAISYSTTSDAVTGEFEIPSVIPNAGYVLTGVKALYVATPVTITVAEGTEKEQDLTLSEFGALAGTVTDETGNVEGGTVNIVAVDTTTPVLYTGTTIADGTYSILNVAPGTYDVWFSKANHVSAKTDDVVIVAATVETQNKVLGEYANYSGVITDGADPVVGATVEFYDAYPGTPAYTATSAALGAWTIPNIEPATYQMKISKALYNSTFVHDKVVAANEDIINSDHVITLI